MTLSTQSRSRPPYTLYSLINRDPTIPTMSKHLAVLLNARTVHAGCKRYIVCIKLKLPRSLIELLALPSD